jgi:hypothetical protein
MILIFELIDWIFSLSGIDTLSAMPTTYPSTTLAVSIVPSRYGLRSQISVRIFPSDLTNAGMPYIVF